MSGRSARIAWSLFALVAAVLAILASAQWADVLRTGRPILYGEGAVAHAAILFRTGQAYRDVTGEVAANYPPLYFALASLGDDPLRTGRAVTILSALAVALVIDVRAFGGGLLVRAGLALSWLALAPVAIWGAAVKPDLLAVFLTLAGVALLERAASRSGRATAVIAGALLAAAVWSKPTAALPAVAVLVWALARARSTGLGAIGGAAAVVLLELLDAVVIGLPDLWRHVVVWNRLDWSAEQALLVLVLGAATCGLLVAAAALAGALRRIALAYLIGSLAVALLGGREGATINYLLDLAAATLFALATIAPRVRASAAVPVAGLVQLALGAALLTPYGIAPGRVVSTGAWSAPGRGEVVRSLGPGDQLVEDSGLLVAEGRSPVVDDLFLWSRLVAHHVVDPSPLLRQVDGRRFAAVVSEADLAHLDAAPAYERARWDPAIVRAVLASYALERTSEGLWVYRPIAPPAARAQVH
ncbi:MAG: hypothetical protein KGJ98_08145 [Chloroflexota bacterium]|nr:hypothetical protein [Chloroflexota bacterium]